jgi:hypothetical protein
MARRIAACSSHAPQQQAGLFDHLVSEREQRERHHRVCHHGTMSDAEWEDAYRAAWDSFYSPEHVRTILRRTAACNVGRPGVTLSTILLFRLMPEYEGVHPLEGGIFRLKFRRDRRHGMKRESPFVFYPAYVWETDPSHGRRSKWLRLRLRYHHPRPSAGKRASAAGLKRPRDRIRETSQNRLRFSLLCVEEPLPSRLRITASSP